MQLAINYNHREKQHLSRLKNGKPVDIKKCFPAGIIGAGPLYTCSISILFIDHEEISRSNGVMLSNSI